MFDYKHHDPKWYVECYRCKISSHSHISSFYTCARAAMWSNNGVALKKEKKGFFLSSKEFINRSCNHFLTLCILIK